MIVQSNSQELQSAPLCDNEITTRLLTAKELAERLSVDQKKIYRMVEAKEIPAIPVGSQWRFDWEEVLSTLKKRSVSIA